MPLIQTDSANAQVQLQPSKEHGRPEAEKMGRRRLAGSRGLGPAGGGVVSEGEGRPDMPLPGSEEALAMTGHTGTHPPLRSQPCRRSSSSGSQTRTYGGVPERCEDGTQLFSVSSERK